MKKIKMLLCLSIIAALLQNPIISFAQEDVTLVHKESFSAENSAEDLIELAIIQEGVMTPTYISPSESNSNDFSNTLVNDSVQIQNEGDDSFTVYNSEQLIEIRTYSDGHIEKEFAQNTIVTRDVTPGTLVGSNGKYDIAATLTVKFTAYTFGPTSDKGGYVINSITTKFTDSNTNPVYVKSIKHAINVNEPSALPIYHIDDTINNPSSGASYTLNGTYNTYYGWDHTSYGISQLNLNNGTVIEIFKIVA